MRGGTGTRVAMGLVLGGMLLLLVGTVPATSAGEAQTEATLGPIARSADLEFSERSSPEPWTAERMRNAVPAPLPLITEGDGAEASVRTVGVPRLVAAQPRGGPVDLSSAEEGIPADGPDTRTDADLRGYRYPAPYTSYVLGLAEAKLWPRRAVGVLFFTQNGGDYMCSASSIGNYAIWTAGHCVHDGSGRQRGWSTDIVFIPAYAAGKPCPGKGCPFGVWTAADAFVPTEWYQLGAADLTDYDWGGVVLNPLNGRSISKRVGSLGFATGLPPGQHWNVLGYPAGAPYNGRRMVTCQASLAYRPAGVTTKLVGIGCDMTGGSSGGPWIIDFGSGNYVNGAVMGARSGKDQEILTTYFDDVAWDLFTSLVEATP